MTSLHTVSGMRNSLSEVERLLYNGADVNARDKNNLTPLHLAAMNNRDDSHFDNINVFLNYGADVNALDSDGKSPLHYLVDSTDIKTLQLFLNFGAVVDIEDKYNETPQTIAVCTNPSVDVVKLLIDHSSRDINSQIGKSNFTLLHWACLQKRMNIVKLLVKNGAKTDVINFDGRTPLMVSLSAHYPKDLKIIRFLYKYSNINNLDSAGNNIINMEKYSRLDSDWKTVLQILAKHQTLNLPIDQSILDSISNRRDFNDYFQKCTEELLLAKNTKLPNTWITYFNLLVDSKKKLKNYAGNQDLIEGFQSSDYSDKFPIYGHSMKKNVEKGIIRRRFFDTSTEELSKCLPIFNPSHLIIRAIMDCLTSNDYDLFLSSGLFINQKRRFFNTV